MRTPLAVAMAAVVLAAWSADAREHASAADLRIEGLRARLVERPAADGSWTARWRLCWRPVAGALGYAVRVASSEGADPRARRVSNSCWSLTVAAGVPQRSDLGPQVALMAPQLSVHLAAVLPGGRTGPPTRDLSVGLPYG